MKLTPMWLRALALGCVDSVCTEGIGNGKADTVVDVVACIPSVNLSPYLPTLLEVLAESSCPAMLFDNSEKGAFTVEQQQRIEYRWVPGQSIYSSWNMAARMADEAGYSFMLLCNDDIEMLPGTVSALVNALADTNWGALSVGTTDPVVRPASLTATSHIAGTRRAFLQWCFLIRLAAWQDVNPNYKIWYGDDDLLLKLERAGWQYGALQGVGVQHHTSTTLNQTSWVNAAIADDIALWTKERGR